MMHLCIVTGAGSSIPYGMPSAADLWKAILRSVKAPIGDHVSEFNLLNSTFQNREDFARELERSRRYSIDEFLRNRSEFIDIGLAAIALEIQRSQYSSKALVGEVEGCWLRHIFNSLCQTRDWRDEVKISFITFNYDTIIEWFLHRSFCIELGLTSEDATTMLKSVEIIHLHGTAVDTCYPSPLKRVSLPDAGRLKEVSQSMKLVFNRPNDEAFKKARELILSADNVVVLGFGFGRENTQRLFGNFERRHARPIYCSRFRMEDGEIPYDLLKDHQIRWGDSTSNSLNILKKFPILQSR